MASIGTILVSPLTTGREFVGTSATDDFLIYDLQKFDYTRLWNFDQDSQGIKLDIQNLKLSTESTFTLPLYGASEAVESIKIINNTAAGTYTIADPSPSAHINKTEPHFFFSTSSNDTTVAPVAAVRSYLYGGLGNDKLTGSAATSVFYGGKGSNQLNGLNDIDIYRTKLSDQGIDTITDSGGSLDRIEIHLDQSFKVKGTFNDWSGLSFEKQANNLVGKVTQDGKTYTFTIKDQYVSGKSIEQVRLYLEEDTRVNSDGSYRWSGVGLTMDNPSVTYAEAGTSKADSFGKTVITEAKENYRAFGNNGKDLMVRPTNESLYVYFDGGLDVDTIQLNGNKADFSLVKLSSGNVGFYKGSQISSRLTEIKDVEFVKFADQAKAIGLTQLQIKESIAGSSSDELSLYRSKLNTFVIDAVGKSSDDYITLSQSIDLTANGRAWTTKGTVSHLLTYEDGTYGVLSFTGTGVKKAFTEQKFSAAGASNVAGIKLSLAELLSKESTFNMDLNGDTKIGDSVSVVYDDGSDEEDGFGLYKTLSGAFVIAEQGLGKDQATVEPMILKVKTKDATFKTAPEALLVGDDFFGVITATGVGAKKVFSQQKFDIETGLAKGSAIKLTSKALFEAEEEFQEDINKDETIGDAITSLLDVGDYVGSTNYDLYKTASGSYLLDLDDLAEGTTASGDGVFLNLAGNKPWTIKSSVEIVGIAEKDSGNMEVLLKTGNTYSAQALDPDSGLMGKVVKLKAADLLAREYYYNQDFTGDEIVQIGGTPPSGWDL
jgi:hypothetical protein